MERLKDTYSPFQFEKLFYKVLVHFSHHHVHLCCIYQTSHSEFQNLLTSLRYIDAAYKLTQADS